jgi:hypothetical protein
MKKTLVTVLSVLAFSILTGCESGPFAKSPKAKASEVEINAGTWSKLQEAYAMEKDKLGSNSEIGFTPFGSDKSDKYVTTGPNTGETKYFRYEINSTGQTATFKATAKQALGDCKDGVWSVAATLAGYKGKITGTGCKELTPNFCNSRIECN